MLKIVQYLIKSRPNSLSLGKSWEVALVSLVPQGFKIPLQSEDTALFQRDWDTESQALSASFVRRKTLPCSKGIETPLGSFSANVLTVGRHCPVPKGLRLGFCVVSRLVLSRKTLPCSKGIETTARNFSCTNCCCRKTLPCSKGIETGFCFKFCDFN